MFVVAVALGGLAFATVGNYDIAVGASSAELKNQQGDIVDTYSGFSAQIELTDGEIGGPPDVIVELGGSGATEQDRITLHFEDGEYTATLWYLAVDVAIKTDGKYENNGRWHDPLYDDEAATVYVAITVKSRVKEVYVLRCIVDSAEEAPGQGSDKEGDKTRGLAYALNSRGAALNMEGAEFSYTLGDFGEAARLDKISVRVGAKVKPGYVPKDYSIGHWDVAEVHNSYVKYTLRFEIVTVQPIEAGEKTDLDVTTGSWGLLLGGDVGWLVVVAVIVVVLIAVLVIVRAMRPPVGGSVIVVGGGRGG